MGTFDLKIEFKTANKAITAPTLKKQSVVLAIPVPPAPKVLLRLTTPALSSPALWVTPVLMLE